MELNNKGLVIRDYATILSALEAVYTSAFPGIDLSPETKEATFCRALALWLEGNENVGLDVWVNLNIDTAEGVALDFIGLLRNRPRLSGAKASASVTFTSTSFPYIISPGTYKLLNTEWLFENAAAINITSLSQVETLTATLNGKTDAQALDKLQSTNYIAQLTDLSISSISDGTDDEDDETYRARLKSSDTFSECDIIYSELAAMIGVTKVRVYENDSSSTDPVTDVPSGHINAVVLGADDQDIGDKIYITKSGGTPTYGSSQVTSVDSQGNFHVIYFDRPSKVNVYISCTATKKETQQAADGSYNTLIRQGCTGYVNRQRIGDDVSYTTIYGLFAKYNAFDIVSLEMSSVSVTSGMAPVNLSVGVREYGYIDDPDNDVVITTV